MHAVGASLPVEEKDQERDFTFPTVVRVGNGAPRSVISVPQSFGSPGNMEVPAVSLGPDAWMQAPILLCCGPGTFQGPIVK